MVLLARTYVEEEPATENAWKNTSSPGTRSEEVEVRTIYADSDKSEAIRFIRLGSLSRHERLQFLDSAAQVVERRLA